MQDPGPLPRLPPRAPDSHKGTFGRALLLGGSRGMSGAITLSGLAALRSGAGLVQLIVPESIQPVVAAAEPSYMVVPWHESGGRLAGDLTPYRPRLWELLSAATSLAIGPGLGRSAGLDELLTWLYSEVPKPLVLDADALNAVADLLPMTASGPRILTPHPGEFARLTRGSVPTAGEREERAARFAAEHQVVLLLKGQHTIITDGVRLAVNETGNPGMATGGSGDVLTGVITALLAQGLSAFDAARLGAHIHGLAGDLAAADVGQVSLIASDLVRFLPQAFLRAS